MSAIFDMSGYELYVWGSVGSALAVFAWNLLAPMMARRSSLKRLRRALDTGESE